MCTVQEVALRDIRALLGPSGMRHSIIVFTHCLNPKSRQQLLRRDQLLDEVSQLPRSSTLRQIVEECSFRVVPVENVLDPAKTESRNALHQRVLDTLAANDNKTYDVANFSKHASTRQRQEHEALVRGSALSVGALADLEEVAAECSAKIFRDTRTGKTHWMLHCVER